MKQTTPSGGDGGVRLELANELSELEPMIEAVEQFCERAGADGGVVSAIMLALEELVTSKFIPCSV